MKVVRCKYLILEIAHYFHHFLVFEIHSILITPLNSLNVIRLF